MKTQIIEVPFRYDVINAVNVDGDIYVAMRPICENIGIDWARQAQKLDAQKDKFNCRHMSTVAADGKTRSVICIPLRKLNGWLFSINPNKVREDIRPALVAYQEECFSALHDYFTKGVAKRPKPEVKRRTGYMVTLTYVNLETGRTETLQGIAANVEGIVTGTASQFGYCIQSMQPIPVNARLIWR